MREARNTRRRFLGNASLAAASVLLNRRGGAQAPEAALRVHSDAPGYVVPGNFIGLSYENMQLEDPGFFSPRNTGLVEQFRSIAKRGVLRLGGNTSEFNWWQGNPSEGPPTRRLVLKNGDRPQDTLYVITPETIRELDGFLQATGWTCIYGLNLGFGTHATDVPEAEFVAKTLGPRLEYFQIGNEVDQFVQYHLRDGETWSADRYLDQWLPIARAVQKAIPEARFGLPDVASRVEWLTRIAERWPSTPDRPHVTTLSHHHYWSGPPSNPAATIERLLRADPVVVRQGEISRAAAAKMGAAYRMTEGNTVYRGGKSGLSDVFAAALWSADYLLTLMHLGYSGVNLHGGSGHAQAVSVGGTFVGEAAMKDPNQPHPKPFYTPIANEGTLAGSGVNGRLNGTYLLEPVGYGMKFVSEFAGTSMLPVDFEPGPVNAVAHAGRRADGKVLLAIVNKDEHGELRVRLPGGTAVHQVLTAPSLAASEAHLLEGGEATRIVGASGDVFVVPKATGASFLLG